MKTQEFLTAIQGKHTVLVCGDKNAILTMVENLKPNMSSDVLGEKCYVVEFDEYLLHPDDVPLLVECVLREFKDHTQTSCVVPRIMPTNNLDIIDEVLHQVNDAGDIKDLVVVRLGKEHSDDKVFSGDIAHGMRFDMGIEVR